MPTLEDRIAALEARVAELEQIDLRDLPLAELLRLIESELKGRMA